MFRSFLRKVASRTKSRSQHRTWWARLNVENLDARVLPSVNAVLHGGVLKVSATADQGTSQVEIIQSPDQITVEDTGTVVNTFPADSVQQIKFKYRELQHQHTKFDLNIPVTTAQMTLTGFNVGEVDLDIGGDTLTATAAATLPDETALTLAGTVDNQGNYDLVGSADINVAGFPLPGASFELTNTSLAVAGTVAVGTSSVPLAGTVDSQGNYDLSGSADLTAAGFSLPGMAARLDQNGMTLAGPLTLPGSLGQVSLTGMATPQGQLSLSGATTLTIGGLPFTTGFTLDMTALHAYAGTNLAGVGPITVTGALAPDGAIHWSGSNQITLGGFGLDSIFTLTNSSLTAAGTVSLPGIGMVELNGTVTSQGQLTMAGIGHYAPGEFPLDAALILSASGMTVSATASLPAVGTVSFTGAVDNQGHFSVATVVPFNVAGFPVTGTFTLTNTSLTAAAGLTLPVLGPVSLPASSLNSQSLFNLSAALGNVTLFGYPVTNTTVTLTNTTLGIAGNVNVKLDQQTVAVHFTGTAHPDGTFQLAGTAAANFVGWASASAAFALTNNGLAVVGDVSVKLDQVSVTVHFIGTAQPNGSFQLAGTAAAMFAGFISGDAVFTLNNSSLTVVGNITIGLDAVTVHVHFMGWVHTDHQFQLTGRAMAETTPKFDGYVSADAIFTLTNNGLRVSGTLDVTLTGVTAHVEYMGSVDIHQQFVLTGTLKAGSTADFDGFFSADAMFSFRNSGAMITGGHIYVVMGGVGVTVNFTATLFSNGSFLVIGSAQTDPLVNGFLMARSTFRIDNSGLTFSGQVDLNRYLPGFPLATFNGWVHPDHQYMLTAQTPSFTTFLFTLSGPTFTLTNTGGTFQVLSLVVLNIDTFSIHGTFSSNGQFTAIGSKSVHIGGFSAYANITFSNSGLVGINAGVNVPYVGSSVGMTGYATGDGRFSIGIGGGFAINGFYGNASLTLSNSGLHAHLDLGISVIHAQAHLDGWIYANGTLALDFGTGVNVSGFSGSISFHLDQTGLSAHLTAQLNVTTTVLGQRFGLTISVDASFAIHTNGTFDIGGHFQARWYAGYSGSVSVGFHLYTNGIDISTPDPLPDVHFRW